MIYPFFVTVRRLVFIWLFRGWEGGAWGGNIHTYGEKEKSRRKVLGRSNHEQMTKNRFQILIDIHESKTKL